MFMQGPLLRTKGHNSFEKHAGKNMQVILVGKLFAGMMQQTIQVKYVNIFTPDYAIAVQWLWRNKCVAMLQVASKQKSITIKSEETPSVALSGCHKWSD